MREIISARFYEPSKSDISCARRQNIKGDFGLLVASYESYGMIRHFGMRENITFRKRIPPMEGSTFLGFLPAMSERAQ